MKYYLLPLWILLGAFHSFSQDVIFVNDDAIGNGSGTSWENANRSLLNAISTTQPNSEIWIAEGTYYPGCRNCSPVNRNSTFRLRDGIRLYGGFQGWENDKNERVLVDSTGLYLYQTILSGDIGLPRDTSDNSYHVVRIQGTSSNTFDATLDGLIIESGRATLVNDPLGDNASAIGAGIFSIWTNLTLSHCHIRDNLALKEGGGLTLFKGEVCINNSIFEDNFADAGGG